MTDYGRTVHAELPDGRQLVRYDRAGKWWVEGDAWLNLETRQIKMDEVVRLAAHPRAIVFFNRPGGALFDSRVRRARFLARWS